jgi:CubicO group peptidase (beta-lactamase class C family)
MNTSSSFFRTIILISFITTISLQVWGNQHEWALFLDNQMEDLMKRYNLPNAAVALVADGRIAFMKGYGYTDLETRRQVDPQSTLFRIGSVSKIFTWTAVMQLVENGNLDLDEEIDSYLDFSLPDRIHGSRVKAGPVTMRHLMTHTSGFEDVVEGLFYLRDTDFPDLREYLTRQMPARIFPPGEVMAYSNYATALAGYIVQRISGMPFEQYIEMNIFSPAGMKNSSFYQPLPENFARGLVSAYRMVDGEFRKGEFEFMPAPAGGMSTTAEDMAFFLLRNLQGGKYNNPDAGFPIFSHHPLLGGMYHGFKFYEINGRRIVFHAGSSTLFDAGFYLIPDENAGLFICYSGGIYTGHVEVFNSFTGEYFPASDEPEEKIYPQPGFVPDTRDLPGEYQQSRRIETGSDKLLNLVSGVLRIRSYGEGDQDVNPQAGRPTENFGVDEDRELVIDLLGQSYHFEQVQPGIFRNTGGAAAYPFGPLRYLVTVTDPFGRLMIVTDGPLTYIRMPFYATSGFAAGVAGLSILVIIVSFSCRVIAWPIRMFRRKPEYNRLRNRIPRHLNMLHASLVILMLISFAASAQPDPVYQLPMAAFGQVTFLGRLAGILPWAVIIITIPIVINSFLAWKNKRSGRIQYSVYSLAALMLAWFFLYYNIVG